MRRQWAAQWSRAERWLRRRLVWRIVVAVLEIRLYDRALTLAGQAFIALVPLLIVVATLLTGSGALALGDWLIGRFALTGASADAVHALFGRPPSVSGGLTILSVLMLLVSLVSFARSIQRTYETAWRLPARGLRRSLHGLQGAFLLLLIISALAYLDSVADRLPGGTIVTAGTQTCAAIPGWWVIGRLLLNRRVTWRLLLPGAVVSAVGQTIVSFAGTHYVPHLIEQNTTR